MLNKHEFTLSSSNVVIVMMFWSPVSLLVICVRVSICMVNVLGEKLLR